jgi:hypothetical protein
MRDRNDKASWSQPRRLGSPACHTGRIAYVLIRVIGVIRGYKSHLIIPRSLFSMNWMISVISSV